MSNSLLGAEVFILAPEKMEDEQSLLHEDQKENDCIDIDVHINYYAVFINIHSLIVCINKNTFSQYENINHPQITHSRTNPTTPHPLKPHDIHI